MIHQESDVIQMKKQGSPSVLEFVSTIIAEPAANQVVLRQEAIALNFVDIMFRNGTFPLNNFPATIGVEAAGVIEQIGKNVTDFAVGDRVGYFFSLGAYAERRLINASDLIRLPDNISFDEAASMMAKGLTARMLIKQAYSVKKGDVILVHAAAGGVGSLVSKWAKALGATVIGTVGSAGKKNYALSHGIDHVVVLDSEDMVKEVNHFTENKGVDVVFDGVGKATFSQSLTHLKNGGTMVLFGSSSGEPAIDKSILDKNSIKLIRPSVGNYLNDAESIKLASEDMFEAFEKGIFGTINPTIYNLKDASKAHQDLESGITKGSVIFHI